MTASGWLEILAFCALLIVLSPLLGGYMAKVYGGQHVFLTPLLGPSRSASSAAASTSMRRASRTGRHTPRA